MNTTHAYGEDDQQLRTEARRFFRCHTEADAVTPAGAARARFIILPDTGHILVRLPRDLAEAGTVVLHTPAEGDGLQLVADTQPADIDDHRTDRFLAHHALALARFDEPTWALATPEMAKFRNDVIDAEDLALANPIAQDEPGLVRLLNADKKRLARLCNARLAALQDPVAVAVDTDGIDIRGRFEVRRIEFPRTLGDAAETQAHIHALLEDQPG